MQGPDLQDKTLKGVTPRVVNTIFKHIEDAEESTEFMVKVSILEIYMEQLRDLLDKNVNKKLNIKTDKVKGTFVDNLVECYVSSEEEFQNLIRIGSSNRKIERTNMNEVSSRSHLITIIQVKQNNLKKNICKTGKLYQVDLAGSERFNRTQAEGKVMEESKLINLSQSCLGNVINAQFEKQSFIPYRNSKLTRVLQESVGGNNLTSLIITCSGASINEGDTVSTLRFGNRAKAVQNKPIINQEISIDQYKIMLARIEEKNLSYQNYIKQLEGTLRKNKVPETTWTAKSTDDNNLDQVDKTDIQNDYGLFDEAKIKEQQEKITNLDEKNKGLESEKEKFITKIKMMDEKVSSKEEDYRLLLAKYTNLEDTNQMQNDVIDELKNEITDLSMKTQLQAQSTKSQLDAINITTIEHSVNSTFDIEPKYLNSTEYDFGQINNIVEKLNAKLKLDEYKTFESDIRSLEKSLALPPKISEPVFNSWERMSEELVAIRHNGLELKRTVMCQIDDMKDMFEDEVSELKKNFDQTLKDRENQVWAKSAAIDDKVISILSAFWQENSKLKRLVDEQKNEVRKKRYDGIIGLTDIECKTDDLTKKIRRLQNIFQSLTLEQNTKKKTVISSFQGYSKDGKMVLDWKLDDLVDDSPGSIVQTPMNFSDNLYGGQENTSDCFLENDTKERLRDIPITANNTIKNNIRKTDVIKKNGQNTRKEINNPKFEKENNLFNDKEIDYAIIEQNGSFIIDEEELDEPVKNLSIFEIKKKIKELEQDPDIDVGIKHQSIKDVRKKKGEFLDDDSDIDPNIRLLSINDVQKRKLANNCKIKAPEVIKTKAAEVPSNKVAKVIKGGGRS